MKLGLSQKLPVLAPALSAPARPASCSLSSSLQAAPPSPSPGGPWVLGKEARSRASDRCRAWAPAGGVRGCGRREEGPGDGRMGYRGHSQPGGMSPRRHLCSSQTLLPKLLFIKLTLLGAEETAWNKTPGRIYSSLASGYHKLSLDYGGKSVFSSPHMAPGVRTAFCFPSSPVPFSLSRIYYRTTDRETVQRWNLFSSQYAGILGLRTLRCTGWLSVGQSVEHSNGFQCLFVFRQLVPAGLRGGHHLFLEFCL